MNLRRVRAAVKRLHDMHDYCAFQGISDESMYQFEEALAVLEHEVLGEDTSEFLKEMRESRLEDVA